MSADKWPECCYFEQTSVDNATLSALRVASVGLGTILHEMRKEFEDAVEDQRKVNENKLNGLLLAATVCADRIQQQTEAAEDMPEIKGGDRLKSHEEQRDL